MTKPLHVLFVCTANICRSPFMQLVADHLAQGSLSVTSAGTHALSDHPMDPTMAAELSGLGIASDAFRSRLLTPVLVNEADLVLTAEAGHRRFILDEQPGAFRTVFTLGQFAEAVRHWPDRSGRELISSAGEQRPASDGLDVDDPFGRGPAAAAMAAARIDGLVRTVMPALSPPARLPS